MEAAGGEEVLAEAATVAAVAFGLPGAEVAVVVALEDVGLAAGAAALLIVLVAAGPASALLVLLEGSRWAAVPMVAAAIAPATSIKRKSPPTMPLYAMASRLTDAPAKARLETERGLSL